MKKKTILLSICMFLLYIYSGITIQAQVQTEEIPPWNKGSIKTQFDYLIIKSTQNGDYRSVKQNWLFILKSRVLDTIKIAQQELNANQKLLRIKTKEVDSLQSVLINVNANLSSISKEKESIFFLGIQIGKYSYHSLVWTIIGILAILLLVFITLFKRSNYITVQTKSSHEELKEEFDAFRKRALQREEELARKYLNELNKYKK